MTKKTNCPVCHGKGYEIFQLKFAKIFRCDDCKHSYSFDIRILPDSIYGNEYFSQKHKKYFENPDMGLFDYIENQIIKRNDQKAHILDVGCGTGNLLKHLYKNGFCHLSGIDLIKNHHEGITFIQGDFLEIELETRYDVVTTIMNIEHIAQPEKYISQIKRILKKDGMLIINTVNENSLMFSIAKLLKRLNIRFAVERLYDPHHNIHFSEVSLKKLCENNGFIFENGYFKDRGLKSIDLPESRFDFLLKFGVGTISFFSNSLGKGFTQTQVFIRR